VGVSGGNFDGMQLVESKLNATCGQDKLQFVCGAVLHGALDHIPNQLISFFQKWSIYPQPEAMVDNIVIDPYNEVEKLDVLVKIDQQGQATVTGPVKKDQKQQVMTWLQTSGKKLMEHHKPYTKHKKTSICFRKTLAN